MKRASITATAALQIRLLPVEWSPLRKRQRLAHIIPSAQRGEHRSSPAAVSPRGLLMRMSEFAFGHREVMWLMMRTAHQQPDGAESADMPDLLRIGGRYREHPAIRQRCGL